MYYLTVEKNGEDLIRRMAFDDYGEAVRYVSKFYEPRLGRGTLSFTTDVVDGEFARSYSWLAAPDEVDRSDNVRYLRAVKMSTAFKYDGSYIFLIESEFGVKEADKVEDEDDDE